MNKTATKVRNLAEGIAQAKANARSFGVTFYVNSVSDGIRVEREPVKKAWAGNRTLAVVEPSGRVKESSEKKAFTLVPSKKEVKYYLYKPRGDYYFDHKPHGLYLYLYDAHDPHTIFSNQFYGRFDIEDVTKDSGFPRIYRIIKKSQEQLYPGYRWKVTSEKIRNAGAMKRTAAAGPYAILLDLERDIRRGYTSFDWDKWILAMGYAKGADYVVGGAGEAIVRNLIDLGFSDRGATDMDKKRVWRILTGNIRMAVADNMIFEGLSAEHSSDTWHNYMQMQRRSVASELLKVAKEVMGYGYHKTYRGDPYWLTLKYPGHCDKCHKPLARGERAYYYPNGRKMFGESCGHGQEAEQDFHAQVEMEEGHLI